MLDNCVCNLLGNFFVIGAAGKSAAADHVHPCFAVFNQTAFEGQPKRVAAAMNLGFSLRFQVVFQCVPRQFVGIFKRLDQALFLQFI